MIYTFFINSKDLEDKLTVPYYRLKQNIRDINKKFNSINVRNLINYCISGSYISEYIKNGNIYLRVQNIKNFEIGLNDDNLVFVNGESIPEKIKVKENDIILARTTVSESNFGNAAIITKDLENCVISQHLTRLSFKDISPYYALTFLNSKIGKLQILDAGYGSTRLELTHDELKKISIPLPNPKLQDKVDDLLKEVFKCFDLSNNLIREAKKYFIECIGINLNDVESKKMFFVNSDNLEDLLTPIFYFPFYREIINKIKNKFKTVYLFELIGKNEIQGGTEIGSDNYKTWINKDIDDKPFIRTSDIKNCEIDLFPDFFVPYELIDEVRHDIKKDDIYFTKDGKVGVVGIALENNECVISSGVAKIRTKNIEPYYLFTVLNSYVGLFQSSQRTVISSTLPHLRSQRLEEIIIPILPQTMRENIFNKINEAFKLKIKKRLLLLEAINLVEDFLI